MITTDDLSIFYYDMSYSFFERALNCFDEAELKPDYAYHYYLHWGRHWHEQALRFADMAKAARNADRVI